MRRNLVIRQEERKRLLRKLRAYRGHTLGGLDVGPPSSFPLAILPFNERALAPLPDDRREVFGEHLRQVAATALGDSAEQDPEEAADTGPAPATVTQCCTICGGHCCPHGGDHAFLRPATIRRVLRARPDLDEEELVESYLRHLGDAIFEGSCVYHGARGCTLPRAMRSDVCNTWLCEGLNALESRLEDADSRRAFLVAAQDGRVVRWRVLDGAATPIADGEAVTRRA